jgi:asparagine synthase (glutamine-hydrolysing)
MCGICGVYVYQRKYDLPQRVIEKMTDIMAHRGPDDEGAFFGYPAEGGYRVGLGHRRLSIIDLTSGHQPMSSADGSCQIVYNGEIYNYLELKKELETKGHVFQTQSDTEVILHLYVEYGEKCLDFLNGIFAFAIWDEKKKKLFMTRDRYGTKPLYYYQDENVFLFASEIKALLQTGLVKTALDHYALKEYFTFQNVFNDLTLFKNIKNMPPASFMAIENNRVTITKYWDISYKDGMDRGESYYIEQLRSMLPRVVKRQLISDVPLGSFLSGGMDSSTLVVLANRYLSPLTTFTCGFNMNSISGLELSFDERKEAAELINDLAITHYEVVLQAGDLQRILPKLVWHLEDLKMGMSYPNYYISELASKFVKVSLSGAGGDEVFAGYPWRYELVSQVAPAQFNEIYFKYWQRLVTEDTHAEFFSPQVYQQNKDYSLFEVFKEVLDSGNNEGLLNKALYFETKTFLAGLLTVDDKLGMANSLEVRVPFLDNELVDFMQTVPAKYKFKENTSKYLMKKAMTGILPDFVLDRKKQGFTPPEQSWYRGQTMGYIRELLLSPRADRGIFNPKYVQRVIDQHVSGQVNHRLLIWSLLCFEWWCRIFLEGEEIPRA